MDTALPLVAVELTGSVGVITLNNVQKRNALSSELIEQLCAALEQMRDKAARVVVLRAPAGVKVFSAGHDVCELPTNGRDPLTYNDPLRRVIREIEMFPAPVIAMIEGSVWGGACDLAVTCDLAIGTPNSTFAITPAKLGVPYTTTGLMRFIGAMPMHIAKELFFTAQPISAVRARELGILNHLVEPDALEAFTYELVSRIVENSPLAIRVLKEQLRVLGNSYPLSPETQERIQGLRRMVYQSTDYSEGKAAFLEKRKPHYSN